jgi:hypothetical protein
MVLAMIIPSSVTEEHRALRHILCRGPFSATFGPLLKNLFRRPPAPPPSPKKFSVSVPFSESKNVFGHTPIFPKDEKIFPETPKNFQDIWYFSPKLKHFDNISKSTVDVYCHCRCLFIVIPYNRINLNHDRINLNLVGTPRGPLTVGGP